MGRYEFSLNTNIKAKDGICPCYGCERKDCWMPFKMREIHDLESEAFEK